MSLNPTRNAVVSLHKAGLGEKAIADQLGIPVGTVSRNLRRARDAGDLPPVTRARAPPLTSRALPRPHANKEWSVNASGVVNAQLETTEPLGRPADVIRALGADPVDWDVERCTFKEWDRSAAERTEDGHVEIVTKRLYGATITLKPRKASHPEKIAEMLKADLAALKPGRVDVVSPAMPPKGQGHTLEIALCDLHVGALAWAPETGADYDTSIATRLAQQAVASMIARTQGVKLERIILRTGDDLLHVDNEASTTTAGTRQDADSRIPKIARSARDVVIEAVRQRLAAAPQVDVVWVQGNHDRVASQMLSLAIEATFANDPRVTVHNAPSARQHLLVGCTHVCYGHGDGAKPDKVPLIMEREAREIWARATNHEFHGGHLHRMSVEDIQGVIYRTAPRLKSTDAWHSRMGYVGSIRALEGYLYHPEFSVISTYVVSVHELRTRYQDAAPRRRGR
jgi:hypothetical protein